MKIVLPKQIRGYGFDRLFAVEMNDFDIERLLPSLFYLVVTGGRERGKKVNDPKQLKKYVDSLAIHPRLDGWTSPGKLRLLERWIRASVVHMGRAGRGHWDEQIEYVLPNTLLAYKTGFPAEARRQRNVHRFVYQLLLMALGDNHSGASVRDALAHLFVEFFGQGTEIDTKGPRFDGQYDGESDLDIHVLLSLCFLDGFQPVPASKVDTRKVWDPALPQSAVTFGKDLLLYLIAYGRKIPPPALTRGFLGLLSLHLFTYTIRLVHGTNDLVRDGELPAGMQNVPAIVPPSVYVDFTRERGSPSDELARACVERDLEELRVFFSSILHLRTRERYAQFQPRLRAALDGLNTPAYLQKLLELQGDMEPNAQNDLAIIQDETMQQALSAEEEKEINAFFESLAYDGSKSAVEKVVRILVSAQEKKAVQAYVQWYWNTGGLRKSYGLLSGNLRGRRSWRYSMGDDLLATLVQLAMIDSNERQPGRMLKSKLRLRDFLEFLETRFGIIVDRPPDFLESPGARANAKDNFSALKRRLRQMGYFQELSDDFTAQYIRNPVFGNSGNRRATFRQPFEVALNRDS